MMSSFDISRLRESSTFGRRNSATWGPEPALPAKFLHRLPANRAVAAQDLGAWALTRLYSFTHSAAARSHV
jgi:hypothetical protein